MRNLYITLTIFIAFNTYSQSNNITLLSNWKDTSMQHSDSSQLYNDCWGWEQEGREYIALGVHHGTYIIDITNSNSPIKVDYIERSEGAIHRDYKTNNG